MLAGERARLFFFFATIMVGYPVVMRILAGWIDTEHLRDALAMATYIPLTDNEIDTLVFVLRGSAAIARMDAERGAVSVREIHLRTAARYEELIQRFEAARNWPPAQY